MEMLHAPFNDAHSVDSALPLHLVLTVHSPQVSGQNASIISYSHEFFNPAHPSASGFKHSSAQANAPRSSTSMNSIAEGGGSGGGDESVQSTTTTPTFDCHFYIAGQVQLSDFHVLSLFHFFCDRARTVSAGARDAVSQE